MPKKIPIAEVAAQLQTTPLNVLMHIKSGMLQGSEEEDGWMIDQASLDNLTIATGGGKADVICASGCRTKHACSGGCG